jgi:hypothetical protein
VTLSRAKEHVQVYTDNLAAGVPMPGTQMPVRLPTICCTRKAITSLTPVTACWPPPPRWIKPLGRRVLAENGLEGETMARFYCCRQEIPDTVCGPAGLDPSRESGRGAAD